MNNKDIRWVQRFDNFKKALALLSEAVKEFNDEGMSKLEIEGMIQRFQYTYELAWNTMKDYYEDQGEVGIQGSKDAIKLAFDRGLITNGNTWFKMVDSRKLTVHTYNQDTADLVAEQISENYIMLLAELETRLEMERHSSL